MKSSHARYNVILLALGLAVLSYMQRVAISEAAGPIERDLHVSKSQMGLVFGAFALSYALFEIPAGLLGDRLGVKRVLTRIVLAWSMCTALTGAAWNVASLVTIRFLFGAGEAGCFPNLTKMLSAWLPERERVRAQSLMWSFTRWGGAATPPLALLCIGWFGWRWAFAGFAALGFLWCLLFLLWFRDDPRQHPAVNSAERELLEASRILTQPESRQASWTSLLVRREVLLLFVQYFFLSYVWVFYITWLPTYLREGRAQSPQRAAALAVLPLLFGGFGSLASGLAPTWVSRRAIAFCGFLFTAILLVALTRITAVVPAMLAMGLASLSSDLTMPISWDSCVEIGGPYTAPVAAAMNMTGNLAGFIAPLLGGVVLERTHGNWNILIDTMAAAALISAACWLALDPGRVQKQRQLSMAGRPTGLQRFPGGDT
jgi:MFS transporter, ACS family, glucarate transporter